MKTTLFASRVCQVLTVLALVVSSAERAAAQAGLVAAYGFNEGSGTSATDVSGNNNVGALSAGVTRSVSGKFGGALVFNSGTVTIPNAPSLALTTAMTLEAWVNPSIVDASWRDVVYKGNDNYYLMATTDFSPRPAGGGTFAGGPATTETFGTANLVANTWTHLAVTYDGATLRLFVNGAQVSSVARTGAITTSTNPLQIGGDLFWGQYFRGTIDEVRVYSRALSLAEVQSDMNTPVGGAPPPDVTAPSVAITAPSGTGTYATSATPVTVSGTASDNVGVTQVTWVNDRGGSGTATGTTSWSASGIALFAGSNIITVTARDAANNTNTATLTVTYTPPDVTAPTIAIVNPSSTGTYTTTASPLALDGTAGDNVGVTQVTWANNRGGSGTATGTTSWSVTGVVLQPGANIITVTARDAANNTAPAQLTVTYNAPDTSVPTIAITAPSGTGTYLTNTSPVTVSGTANDNVGVTQVTWTNTATGVSGAATGTTSWSISGIVLQAGANPVQVTARDAANNVASATVTVTLDATVPVVTLTAPGAGATVSGNSVAFTASATDNGAMGGVTLLVDGVATGSEITGAGPTYNGTWNTTGTPNGTHLLSARARDAAGNTAVSPTVSVTVANAAPSGLVAAYGFNEGSGTSATDVSGNNNVGALSAGVTRSVSGKFGGALVFNSGTVTIPNAPSLALTTAMTLEAWVNPSIVDASWRDVVYKGNDNYYLMATTDFSPRPAGGGTFAGGPATTETFGTANLVANTWTHLAVTYDGATLRLFVNGAQVSSVARTGAITTSTNPLQIGGDLFWGQYFRGTIDEVRVYSRALSLAEVQSDMNTPVGGAPPPDVTAPSVAITAPSGTGTYATSATPVTVSGTASDNVGVTQVTWVNDRGGSGTATGTTSWSASGIALFAGSNIITVTARDAANNTNTATLTVTYTPPDVTAPTIAIVNPSSTGTYTTTASPLALDGTAGDNVGVTQVTWANNRGGSGTATGTTSWSVTGVVLQPGANIITVTARDAANNTAPAQLTVTHNAPDTSVPTIAITAPSGTGTYLTNTSPVTVSGTANDNVGVTQVTWTNTATGVSGAATGTTSWSISGIVLQAGANPVQVTARDAANNVASATVTVTLDATVPVVTLTAPGAGATVSGNSVAFTASATDNGAMGGVTLLVDGVATGSEITGAGPTYNGTWNTTGTPNGTHLLSARARDAAGNTAVSPTVSVTVANAAPSGLVAAYGFNEGSGTSATDVSGNNNVGALSAGVTRSVSGKFGGALVFNSGTVTIPNAPSLALTTAMTLEAWVNPSIVDASWRDVVYKGNDNYYLMATTDFSPRPAGGGTFAGGPATTETFGTANLVANTWTHLAVTYDGATLRLFVNGAQVSSVARTGAITTSTNPLQIGGDLFWGQYFRGTIDEVRVYSRALSLAEVQSDMNTPVGGTSLPDVTPPTVAITAPSEGAAVSGFVTLTANASDDVAVVGVQFLVDGSPLGAELHAAPYTLIWDANQAIGPHTLEAIAHDGAGNTTHSEIVHVTVTISSAATVGQWTAPFAWPLVGLHAALLKTGEVLSWEFSGAGGPFLWNPLTGDFTSVPEGTNKFCAGQSALPDGRFLIAGGHSDTHVGITNLNIFDPATRSWSAAPNMTYARWYPTVTGLADGRSLITAGEINCSGCNALIPEIYNPVTNQVFRITTASANFPYYPHMYVLPDGRVFAAATAEAPIVSKVLNLTLGTWSTVDPVAVDGGSSVMYLPGKIMKSGTSHDPDLPPDPSSNKTYVIDMTAPTPSWTQTASMAFPRTYHNMTVLPDGNVLVTGGGNSSDAVSAAGAVLTAEMWNPTTKTYTTLSSGAVPRLYHSWAMLLPDARVLVGAGGRFNGFPSNDPSDKLNAEIYYPAYLFKGARPTITSAPQSATVGTSITVQTPDAANIASVSLIKLASVTHSFNTDQRFLPLTFTAGAGSLNVTMPANANLAPPGYYMLFIVDGTGVPSTAAMIRVQ